MSIRVAIVNESTAVSDTDVKACMAALQLQVTEDFGPAYGMQVTLYFLPKGSKVPAGDYELVFADNSDQVGALGYHETTSTGSPIGFVFCKDDITYGTSWTVTASHELLEMLDDPDIQTAEQQDMEDGSTIFRMKEACDVCEDDSLAYPKGGKLSDGKQILVSDFVLPAYWVPNAVGPYDFKNHINAPLTILSGGYIGILTVPNASWQQITADKNMKPGQQYRVGGKEIKPFNRRARRMLPDAKWKPSER